MKIEKTELRDSMKQSFALVVGILIAVGACGVLFFVLRADEPLALDDSETQIIMDESPQSSSPRRTKVPAGGVEPSAELDDTTKMAAGGASTSSLLYGRVITSDQNHSLNSIIKLSPDGKGKVRQVPMTGAGMFSIANLERRTWTLTCVAEGYVKFVKKIDTRTPTVLSLDINLEKIVVIKVRVLTPTGKNLFQEYASHHWLNAISVFAFKDEPVADLSPSTRTHLNRLGEGIWTRAKSPGNWSVPPESHVGTIELKSPLPLCLSLALGHQVLQSKIVVDDVDQVEFVIDPKNILQRLATVSGRILDSSLGRPIANCTVMISDGRAIYCRKRVDKDGYFQAKNVPLGLMRLIVQASGREQYGEFIQLERGQTLELGDIRLSPSLTIQGTVVYENGPGASHKIIVRKLDRVSFPQPLQVLGLSQSFFGGKFKISNRGTGRYWIVVKGGAERATVGQVVTVGEVNLTDVEILVPKGVPVTIEPNLDSTDQFLLRIEDTAKLPIVSEFLSGNSKIHLRLVPGTYHMTIYRGLEEITSKSIEVEKLKQVVSVP